MTFFVWSKMQTESGQLLDKIIPRKKAERVAGHGLFWWGIGNSLGPALREAAVANGGNLPVLFSVMRARPQAQDIAPDYVYLWTAWQDAAGTIHQLPSNALVISRGHPGKTTHYALACRSEIPLKIDNHRTFDPALCRTRSGRLPGASQVTALLSGDLTSSHTNGTYRISMCATLVDPWVAKLVQFRRLSSDEREAVESWCEGDWMKLVSQLRRPLAV